MIVLGREGFNEDNFSMSLFNKSDLIIYFGWSQPPYGDDSDTCSSNMTFHTHQKQIVRYENENHKPNSNSNFVKYFISS